MQAGLELGSAGEAAFELGQRHPWIQAIKPSVGSMTNLV
jgi:hypothetical protein